MMIGQFRAASTQATTTNTLEMKNSTLDVLQALQAAADKKAEKRQNAATAKVTLSNLGKLRAKMRQGATSVVSKARKSAARAHAAQLKQQIEVLKKIAVMLGPLASKTLLRQIRQIARQVRQIAAELAQSSSAPGSVAMTADGALAGCDLSGGANVDFASDGETESGEEEPAPEENVEAETAAAQAAENAGAGAAEAEAEAASAVATQAEQAASAAEEEIKAQENGSGQQIDGGRAVEQQQDDPERQADMALIRDLVKELRLLLSLAKATLPKKDKEDKENLREIDEHLDAVDDLVRKMATGGSSATGEETAALAASGATISVFV
jgi:hypothetical protein